MSIVPSLYIYCSFLVCQMAPALCVLSMVTSSSILSITTSHSIPSPSSAVSQIMSISLFQLRTLPTILMIVFYLILPFDFFILDTEFIELPLLSFQVFITLGEEKTGGQ
jgi:hypothetical protein